jgi:hypothetical protein
MEALFIYIAKSSGLVLLFYFAYYFLLRKETFFNSNRWFLLAGLITSAILPFAVYTKVIWVNPTPLSNVNYASLYSPQIEKDIFEINWNLVLITIYSIGFLALLIKFAFDFYCLNSVLKGKQIKQQADFKFVDINENIAPFSYFEYIVYNSSMYTASELESIIEHEKVHSDQNHTIDVLISRAFCILFWFNPIIWLYKKAITQNLEFIADAAAAQKIADKKAYQYTLLKITTHESCLSITNHFYQSLIKKRIVMLNKNQSKKGKSWKLYVIIPALVAFALLFQIEVIAKEKREFAKEAKVKDGNIDVYKISKTTTDQQLKEMAEKMKLNHNVDAKISDVERNSDNELTAIRFDLKSGSEQSQSYRVKGSKAIKDCEIVIETESDGSKKIGLKTDNQIGEVKIIDKERKVEVKKVTNSKTNCDVKTTDNTHTSISTSNSANNTDTNVNTKINTNVKVGYNRNITTEPKLQTNISVVSNDNINTQSKQLIIVNGEVVYDGKIRDLNSDNIKTIHINKSSKTSPKDGEEDKNSVIEIETEK